MRLYAATARRARGVLLGGDEGRQLRTEAEADLARVGVVEAGRFTRLLAPGVVEGAT